MVSLTRHSRESGNPGLQGSNRWPWTPTFAGATKKPPPRARSASPASRRLPRQASATKTSTICAPCWLPGASFVHLPIYGLEDLGFVPRGEAGSFIAERDTAPGVPGTARRAGRPGIPLNTNGGGLSYMHPACTACTHCRRACARCAASPPPRSRAPRFRSAMVSAACSPPPAPLSCRTRRLKIRACSTAAQSSR